MPKIFTLILFTSFITTSYTFAQTNYKAGHIIVAEGDTLKGFIDDRGDQRNAQVVSYKSSENSPLKEFLPTEVKGYKVGQKLYLSHTFDDKGQQVTTFLELINDGSLKFLYWKDRTDKVRFFAQKNTTLYELTNEQREVKENGKKYFYYSNEYVGILQTLTTDCEKTANATISFTLKSISNFVENYNACLGNNVYSSEKPAKKVLFKKSVFAGAISSQVVTEGTTYFSETSKRSGLSAGVALHMNFPGINDKIFVDLITEYNQKGGEAIKENIDFNLHYLNFTPGLSYVYPKGKLRPTIGAGFVTGYLFNKETAYLRTRHGKQIRIFDRPDQHSEVVYEMGYEARAGFKYVLTPDLTLLLKVKYSKTLIPFNFISGKYINETVSVQLGVEF